VAYGRTYITRTLGIWHSRKISIVRSTAARSCECSLQGCNHQDAASQHDARRSTDEAVIEKDMSFHLSLISISVYRDTTFILCLCITALQSTMATLYGISRKSSYSPIQLQDRVDRDTQAGLLLTEHARRPDGWPASPKVVKPTIISVVSDLTVDLILLFFSLLFLAFALTVRHYDQASISSNPRAFDLLSQATRYVSRDEASRRLSQY
jgi:hypothetical protein